MNLKLFKIKLLRISTIVRSKTNYVLSNLKKLKLSRFYEFKIKVIILWVTVYTINRILLNTLIRVNIATV